MLRHLKRVLDAAATIAVIAVAGAILLQMTRQQETAERLAPVTSIDGLSIASSSIANLRGTGTVVLLQFSDFECSFCARHAQTTARQIREAFVDSGRIQEAFLHYPLERHIKARKAAEAAECAAAQGRFWEMTELIFEDKDALEPAALVQRASDLDLDVTRFEQCLSDNSMAPRVQLDMAEGKRLGVDATPVFFVGTRGEDGTITLRNRINGALPFEQFSQVLGRLLTESVQQQLGDPPGVFAILRSIDSRL